MSMTFEELEEHEYTLLQLILLRHAGQPFNEDQRAAIQYETLSGAQLHLAFLSLRRKGYIETVKKAWGERMYFIASPQPFAAIQSIFYSYAPVYLEPEDIYILRESGPGVTLDVLHILAFAAHQGLALTSKGTLHKKMLQKLSELSHVQPNDLEGLHLQYAHPEIYPPHIAVILDLLFCLGLIRQEPQALVIEEERLHTWLTSPLEEMNKILLQTVMERYSPNEPTMQHFRYLICQPTFAEGRWFDVTSLLEWMRIEQLMNNDSMVEVEKHAEAWFCALSSFGFGDTGRHDGKLVFKWNHNPSEMLNTNLNEKISNADGKFYVQPDFDIIVPPEVPFLSRWQLLAFTELRHSDRVSVYRLTKNSVTEGVEKGLSISILREILAEGSISGVPEHINITLEQWDREIGRTRLDEVTLLSCSSEEEGHRIASHPHLPENVEQIGPRHFIVNPSAIILLRKALDSMGLTALKQIGGPIRVHTYYPLLINKTLDLISDSNPFSETEFTPSVTQGIVYSGRNMHYFEKDNEMIEPQSLFPDLSQVPALWYTVVRGYHTSTAQTIMEQALAWQTKVRLHLRGSQADFVPRKIYSNPWGVEGELIFEDKDEIPPITKITTDDWEEMMILLPEL